MVLNVVFLLLKISYVKKEIVTIDSNNRFVYLLLETL